MNFATPWLASFSFELLVVSRMVLGVMQAAIFPALYDLFAKWLTMTETSIFAPLIKVAFSLGILMGSLLPGVIISNGFGWPLVFHASGAICFVWALVWCFVSNSSPQESRFVCQAELERIMRKKNVQAPGSSTNNSRSANHKSVEAATDSNNSSNSNLNRCDSGLASEELAIVHKKSPSKEPTPWRLILTSPSVLSLILVKFTYQLCLDFASIELASYLKNAFHTPVEIVSILDDN